MLALLLVACFTAIAVGRIPIFRMNRATIALVGAVLVILLGGLSLPKALSSLDLGTLSLLFGVMILSVNLSYSGFFRLVAYRITRHARTGHQLLTLVIATGGLLSAVFLNDTICLMLTPLVIEVAARRGLSPLPFLLALALSANVGSAATVIGNPQNILIGAVSAIPFFTFVGHLVVPVVAGLALVWLVLAFVFRREVTSRRLPPVDTGAPRVYRPLLVKSLVSALLLLAGIVAGLSTTLAALLAASFLLVSRRIKPDRVLRDVDWSLLVFFASLFILTASIRSLPYYARAVSDASHLMAASPILFALFSIGASNLISNVPTVMLLRPLVEGFPDAHAWWLLLSMATTFAGNLTLLGSVANLIVAEGARKRGITLSFGLYLKVGVPVTLLTAAAGTAWLLATIPPR